MKPTKHPMSSAPKVLSRDGKLASAASGFAAAASGVGAAMMERSGWRPGEMCARSTAGTASEGTYYTGCAEQDSIPGTRRCDPWH